MRIPLNYWGNHQTGYSTLMVALAMALHPPESPFPIRTVRLTDVDSLQHDCWPERAYDAIYNLVTRAIQNLEQKRGMGIVIQKTDETVIGYGQYVIWPTCAEISDLIIATDYRGQGLGTAVVQTLTRAAASAGVAEAEIGAARSNPRAAALYHRLGFEDSHTLMLNLGQGKEEVIFMRLPLSPSQPA